MYKRLYSNILTHFGSFANKHGYINIRVLMALNAPHTNSYFFVKK